MNPILQEDLLKLSARLQEMADKVFYEYPGVAEQLRQEAEDLETTVNYWLCVDLGEMVVFQPDENPLTLPLQTGATTQEEVN